MDKLEIENIVGEKLRDVKFRKGRFLYYFDTLVFESPKIDKGKAKWVGEQKGYEQALIDFQMRMLSKMLEGNIGMIKNVKDGRKQKNE